MLLLLALACRDTAEIVDTAGAVEDPTCEPITAVVTQSFTEDDLFAPAGDDLTGNLGVALADLDDDGRLDLVIAHPRVPTTLLQGDGTGHFTDSGWLLDGGPWPPGVGLAAGDIDGDGDTDLILGTAETGEDLLALNDGGSFTGVGLGGQERLTTTPTLGDIDGDGDLDLFLARYASDPDVPEIVAGNIPGSGSALYRNDGGTLTRADEQLPAEMLTDICFQGSFLDYDSDGDLDLYTANDFGMFLQPNRMLDNDGSGHFSPAADCACELAQAAMGIAIGDANRDAWPDLYVTDFASPSLLIGDGDGRFIDSTLVLGAERSAQPDQLTSWGTVFADVNADGWEDLSMVFGPLAPEQDPEALSKLDPSFSSYYDGPEQRDALLLNSATGFTDASAAAGFEDTGIGRVLISGDIDNDGRLELIVGGMNYVNVVDFTGGCAGSVTLDFSTGPNQPAVGARVEATLSGRPVTRWLAPSSTWSSSAAQISLGLGEASVLDEVRITWPDGATTTLTDLEAGSVVAVTR